eukprot:CAMPEP_0176120042 /NCGR_PEP_ID=MMETSP0120_2-20121206/60371_1 /TAXON_ID=160619 /ORGANISM="Kryptoperidinium foliaceum, Strain CCMP 1326" /LENGTH=59 /DNA_ID=CAMNT_0017454475 /DNA_START=274 /DNA_END=454 /DNA_ORIENTATION=-
MTSDFGCSDPPVAESVEDIMEAHRRRARCKVHEGEPMVDPCRKVDGQVHEIVLAPESLS